MLFQKVSKRKINKSLGKPWISLHKSAYPSLDDVYIETVRVFNTT